MHPEEFVEYSYFKKKRCPVCQGTNVGKLDPMPPRRGWSTLFCDDCDGFPMYCGTHHQEYILHSSCYNDVSDKPCQLCGSNGGLDTDHMGVMWL